jgi:transcriptional regulator with XRE-family HTH domain
VHLVCAGFVQPDSEALGMAVPAFWAPNFAGATVRGVCERATGRGPGRSPRTGITAPFSVFRSAPGEKEPLDHCCVRQQILWRTLTRHAKLTTLRNMTDTKSNTLDLPLIAVAIRKARKAEGMGVRELGREAGVAAPQISRLEKGEVRKPSVETLVSLARALNRNPVPLLVLAGYFDAEETRGRLAPLLADGSELLEDWEFRFEDGKGKIVAARAVLEDPAATLQQLQQVAYEVWITPETHETLWDEAFFALAAPSESDHGLQELVAVWPLITRDRRAWLLQAARDQLQLARQEYAKDIAEQRAEEARERQSGEIR